MNNYLLIVPLSTLELERFPTFLSGIHSPLSKPFLHWLCPFFAACNMLMATQAQHKHTRCKRRQPAPGMDRTRTRFQTFSSSLGILFPRVCSNCTAIEF